MWSTIGTCLKSSVFKTKTLQAVQISIGKISSSIISNGPDKVYPRSTIVNESEFKQFRREFKIPAIHTVFKMERSPFDSDPRLSDWVNHCFEYSLMEKRMYDRVKVITIFATYFYPFCDDIHRFEQLVKVFLSFFILDDHTECEWGDVARNTAKNSGLVWEQAIAAIDKIQDQNKFVSMNGWKPYTVLWFIVLEEICRQLNPISKKRLLDVMRRYCYANIEESDKIEAKYNFSLEEMIALRRDSIACYCVYALLEYSNNISITEQDWNDPDLQQYLLVATDAIIYNNDIVSFEKEYLEQNRQLDRMYNAVARTAIQDNITIEEAMEKIAKISMDYEQKTVAAMEMLLKKDLSKELRKFIELVGYQMGGHFKVGTLLDRYNKLYD